MTTELSFWGHACIRLDREGRRLVVDPGSFSSPDALTGAHAVLVTHEHADHVVPDQLRAALEAQPELEVWAPGPVAEQLAGVTGADGRVHTVVAGDHVTAGGFDVAVVGGSHAVIHPDVPVIANVGYLVDGTVLHPGDAFDVPEAAHGVDVLCLPVAAPWLKLAEAVEFTRAVGPRVLVPIHDAHLSGVGNAMVDRLLSGLAPGEYRRLSMGDGFTLG
ncbi:MBL fold metallo-hydrolase [Cellulomonas cellasea]|uniref:L-ascorbate metabolism protein UlaG (Beta-lactamase superfamily) n=1 Tax=Cellulomonas cellasea TaxID=43670 RepID=A0A7W4UD83_9CELL|nr:MBL fold metallo-hydrolase [Cellulomonas cellasea]MBB2921917.1 L-ascorbate metabolism protein UlaG (beta-lactamase superfamily) [Cellulomonas cellasea]